MDPRLESTVMSDGERKFGNSMWLCSGRLVFSIFLPFMLYLGCLPEFVVYLSSVRFVRTSSFCIYRIFASRSITTPQGLACFCSDQSFCLLLLTFHASVCWCYSSRALCQCLRLHDRYAYGLENINASTFPTCPYLRPPFIGPPIQVRSGGLYHCSCSAVGCKLLTE